MVKTHAWCIGLESHIRCVLKLTARIKKFDCKRRKKEDVTAVTDGFHRQLLVDDR